MSHDARNDPGPHENDPVQPRSAPLPPPPSLLRRIWHWHRALKTGDKLALYGVVLTALVIVTPLAATAWNAAFGGTRVAMLVEQYNDPCFSIWVVPPEGEPLFHRLEGADERQYTRWEREEQLVHTDNVEVKVSLRGADRAVEIRDITITVLRRDEPVAGPTAGPLACGSGEIVDEPDYIVVDLDTLPLGRDVPVSYLQQSDQQAAAIDRANQLGEAIQLPRTVEPDDFYNFSLVGRTAAHDTDWQATITWWDGEELHHDRLDDDGSPFRVSAAG